jgi:glyoxylase-like metal-dependent hydrolase (beta-lactamase superfamily II)
MIINDGARCTARGLGPGMPSSLLVLAAGAVCFATPNGVRASQDPTAGSPPGVPRNITSITDSLYRVQYGMHISALLVTPEGVLVTDPTNPDAARWIRTEIKKRFNKPVRYLIYSHSHSDHIGGASVLATPGVTILANELTRQYLVDDPYAGANIPVPTRTFSGETTLKFGGQTIRLFQVEPWTHARDLIAIYFVDQKALYAPDLISVKSVGFLDFSNERFLQMIEAIGKIQRIDYQIVIDSHGPLGTKADADRFLEYLSDLKSGAEKAVLRGEDAQQAKKSIDLSRYKDLAFFNIWSGLNIEGAMEAVALDMGHAKLVAEEPAVTPERLAGLTIFCSACHGPDGVSSDGAYPNLAGQKYDYLAKSLKAYQTQQRYDPYMSEIEFVTPEEIEALARHYSALKPVP